MARPRKLALTRQNTETKDLALLAIEPPQVPEPPYKLNAKAAALWQAFWLSPVARAVDLDSDGFAIERWITYTHDWHKCTQALRRQGFTVEGSQGQTVLNPMARMRDSLETSIAALEKQIGLTPAARTQLGISINAFKKGAVSELQELQETPPEAMPDDY